MSRCRSGTNKSTYGWWLQMWKAWCTWGQLQKVFTIRQTILAKFSFGILDRIVANDIDFACLKTAPPVLLSQEIFRLFLVKADVTRIQCCPSELMEAPGRVPGGIYSIANMEWKNPWKLNGSMKTPWRIATPVFQPIRGLEFAWLSRTELNQGRTPLPRESTRCPCAWHMPHKRVDACVLV